MAIFRVSNANENFKNMKTKEWIQYGSAALMILSGIVLSFISFFINGDVRSSG